MYLIVLIQKIYVINVIERILYFIFYNWKIFESDINKLDNLFKILM